MIWTFSRFGIKTNVLESPWLKRCKVNAYNYINKDNINKNQLTKKKICLEVKNSKYTV